MKVLPDQRIITHDGIGALTIWDTTSNISPPQLCKVKNYEVLYNGHIVCLHRDDHFANMIIKIWDLSNLQEPLQVIDTNDLYVYYTPHIYYAG